MSSFHPAFVGVDDWYSFVPGFTPSMKRLLFVLAFVPCIVLADLTQAQMTAAMVQALKDYAVYSTGEDWALGTVPLNEDVDVAIADYLDINGRSGGIARYLRQNINDWFYPTMTNLASGVRFQQLTANAVTQLASRVSSQLVQKLEDYLDAAAWPTLLSDTSNLGYLSTINGYMYDVYSDLSTLRYLLQNSQADILSILSGSAYTLTNILDKVDDVHIDLTGVYSKLEDNVDMISQILGEIEADSSYIQMIASDTSDINENTGDILNFLQDELDEFLVNAFAGLTLSAHLDTTNMNVTVENWPTNYLVSLLQWNELDQYLRQQDYELKRANNLSEAYNTAFGGYLRMFGIYADNATNYYTQNLLSNRDKISYNIATNEIALTNSAFDIEAANLSNTWDSVPIEIPYISEPSNPSIPDERSDAFGLSSVDTSLNHGRTILFTSGVPLYSIPRMEYDLYRENSMSSALGKFSTLMQVFWTALFTLFTVQLYYKAYRGARAMLLASRGFNKSDVDLSVGFISDNGVL